MKCPKWQQENEEGAKFREECAAPLQEETQALAAKCFECSLSGEARLSVVTGVGPAIAGRAEAD
jgi:hypothetical protein